MFVYIGIAVGNPIIRGIPLISKTPHFCACPKLEPGFPTSYVVVFFIFDEVLFFVFLNVFVIFHFCLC
jgi:hypothetical protein